MKRMHRLLIISLLTMLLGVVGALALAGYRGEIVEEAEAHEHEDLGHGHGEEGETSAEEAAPVSVRTEPLAGEVAAPPSGPAELEADESADEGLANGAGEAVDGGEHDHGDHEHAH